MSFFTSIIITYCDYSILKSENYVYMWNIADSKCCEMAKNWEKCHFGLIFPIIVQTFPTTAGLFFMPHNIDQRNYYF